MYSGRHDAFCISANLHFSFLFLLLIAYQNLSDQKLHGENGLKEGYIVCVCVCVCTCVCVCVCVCCVHPLDGDLSLSGWCAVRELDSTPEPVELGTLVNTHHPIHRIRTLPYLERRREGVLQSMHMYQ